MLSIFLAGVLLGFLIAVTNDGDFPEWQLIVICLAAAILPTAILNFCLPEGWAMVAPLVGAACCTIAISTTIGMSWGRAAFSAFMFFAAQIGLGLLLT